MDDDDGRFWAMLTTIAMTMTMPMIVIMGTTASPSARDTIIIIITTFTIIVGIIATIHHHNHQSGDDGADVDDDDDVASAPLFEGLAKLSRTARFRGGIAAVAEAAPARSTTSAPFSSST